MGALHCLVAAAAPGGRPAPGHRADLRARVLAVVVAFAVDGQAAAHPLALLTIPVVAFFGIVALSLLPVMLLVLVPIFCLIPWVIMTTLPLFGVFSCVGIPLLNYIGVPVWLSIKWTWPFPDFSAGLSKLRSAKK